MANLRYDHVTMFIPYLSLAVFSFFHFCVFHFIETNRKQLTTKVKILPFTKNLCSTLHMSDGCEIRTALIKELGKLITRENIQEMYINKYYE